MNKFGRDKVSVFVYTSGINITSTSIILILNKNFTILLSTVYIRQFLFWLILGPGKVNSIRGLIFLLSLQFCKINKDIEREYLFRVKKDGFGLQSLTNLLNLLFHPKFLILQK